MSKVSNNKNWMNTANILYEYSFDFKLINLNCVHTAFVITFTNIIVNEFVEKNIQKMRYLNTPIVQIFFHLKCKYLALKFHR